MMRASSLLLAAGLAAAQSTTIVKILLPMADPQSIAGSVISAGPTATSYFITCPSNAADEDNNCGLGDGISVIYGPSTFAYVMTYSSETAIAQCQLDPSKDTYKCTGSLVSGDSTQTVPNTVMSGYSSLILPVTITAGAEKLSDETTGTGGLTAPTATSTGVASTTLGTSAVGSNSASSSADESSSPETTSSQTSSQTSSSSSGGMPQITQNAILVGAAALVGGAMML